MFYWNWLKLKSVDEISFVTLHQKTFQVFTEGNTFLLFDRLTLNASWRSFQEDKLLLGFRWNRFDGLENGDRIVEGDCFDPRAAGGFKVGLNFAELLHLMFRTNIKENCTENLFSKFRLTATGRKHQNQNFCRTRAERTSLTLSSSSSD